MRERINRNRVKAGKPRLNVMPTSHFPNLSLAFNESASLMSGPKVDSFWRNLYGDLDPGTLDTRMAQAFGWDQASMKGANRIVKGTGKRGIAGPGYTLGNALLGKVSDVLGIQRGEAQEGVWEAVGKALGEHGVGAGMNQPEQLRGLSTVSPFHGIMGQGPQGVIGRNLGSPDPADFNMFLRTLQKTGEGRAVKFGGLAALGALGLMPFMQPRQDGAQ
jgi:hypothetical protein